jgi:hypothetical protein
MQDAADPNILINALEPSPRKPIKFWEKFGKKKIKTEEQQLVETKLHITSREDFRQKTFT